MEPASQSLTETLANLSLAWILLVVTALTVVRLGLIKVPSPTSRSAAEILESGIIAIVLVFLVIRPFVMQAFFIPSASMEPTLLGNHGVGDRILVNKFLYRIRAPHRDDVVVFVPPPEALQGNLENAGEGTVNFIKRLVAVPGDHLEVHRGRVLINGLEYSHARVRLALQDAGYFGKEAQTSTDGDLLGEHHAKFVPDGVLADGKLVSKPELARIMTNMPDADVQVIPGYNVLNGRRLTEPFIAEDPDYDLKLYQGQPLKYDPSGAPLYKLDGQSISKDEYDRDDALPTGTVPPGHYFMMGDNRNDSHDSTNWGTLEARRVVGAAQFIFWPLSRMRPIR